VVTSIPLECLFSVAGNIVGAKTAAVLRKNVEKLVFFHENILLKKLLITSCCPN